MRFFLGILQMALVCGAMGTLVGYSCQAMNTHDTYLPICQQACGKDLARVNLSAWGDFSSCECFVSRTVTLPEEPK